VYLPDSDLWLDPHHAREVAIVSHAHADHMCAHQRVFATPATAAMMKVRGARGCHFQTVEWGEVLEIGGAEVTLVPAGHVLGSAQVLVEKDGVRLLYSGDFKLRPGLSAEPAAMPQADILVMETTFGRPRYRFPDSDDVLGRIRDFSRDALECGEAPVLFCYSLGKGQEVLAGLSGVAFPIYLHEKHFHMANLYRAFGVHLPPYRLYVPGQKCDGVLLCASGCRKGRWFKELECTHDLRTAYISGWALDPGARWRHGVHEAFPLSDHADYEDLIQYACATGARTVYTMHGFAHEFASDLRDCGFDAKPL
jgi:Cft2 family RNA processing exonuclease